MDVKQLQMTNVLNIRLLGGLRVDVGEELVFPTRKTALLLAMLAAAGGEAVSRDKIREMFWGDRGETQAAGSLRRALSDLRRGLGGYADVLQTSSTGVGVDPELVTVDSVLFARLARQAEPDSMRSAALLYRGPFLERLDAREEPLEDWLRLERDVFHNLASELAERLATVASDKAELEAAEKISRVLLASDPACEEAHRALILYYQKGGRTNAAIKQYAICAEELSSSLGVEPDSRTRTLIENPVRPLNSVSSGATHGGSTDRRPSIAVIPFQSRGEVKDTDIVAEGLAEEVQTELSRLRDFVVISSQSTSDLGSKTSSEIHELLGATYLLRGAVHHDAAKLRITCHLVLAEDGSQLWAGRYDIKSNQTLDVIDQIATELMSRLDPQLRTQEYNRSLRLRPESMTCWELFHRGMWHAIRGGQESLHEAEDCFLKAKSKCPKYPAPLAGLAMVKMRRLTSGSEDADPSLLEEAVELGKIALALDPYDYVSLTIHANALAFAGEAQAALDHIGAALELNASYAMAHYARSRVLFYIGEYAEALPAMEQAIRSSPLDPQMGAFLAGKAGSLYGLRRFDEMLEAARASSRTGAPIFWSDLLVAVAALNVGRRDEANAAVAKIRTGFPNFSRGAIDPLTERLAPEFRNRFNADLQTLGIG